MSEKSPEVFQKNNSTKIEKPYNDQKDKINLIKKEEEKENKTEKANYIGNIIEKINTEIKLTDGLDIGDGKEIVFNKNSQELKIGEDTYGLEVNVKDKNYNIEEIIINGEKITFVADAGELAEITGQNKRYISKNIMIDGIKRLLMENNISFNNQKGTILTLTKKS